MKVYRAIVDSNRYDTLRPERRRSVDWLARFDGTPLAARWKPQRAAFEPAGARADLTHFAPHVLVANGRAQDALLSGLGGAVEVLPLVVDEAPDERLVILNVIDVRDCLDRERSDLLLHGDFILHVGHYVFRDDTLVGATAFRIAGYTLGGVFVTEAVRERIEAAGLTGLVWEELE